MHHLDADFTPFLRNLSEATEIQSIIVCVSLSSSAQFCSTVYRPGETHPRSLTSTVLHVAVNGFVLSALPCTVCAAKLWHGIGARALTCLVHFAAPTQNGTLAGSLPVLPVRPSSINCKENEDW